MKNIYSFFIFLTVALLLACNQKLRTIQIVGNPPAVGFDAENSDAQAIAIADEVMAASGGRQNWENTRLIKWNFFDSRKLVWDKHMGQVRIDFLKEDLKIIVNLTTEEGKALRNDTLFTEGPIYEQLMEKGKSVWINDAYWLVLPFKLKDTGVTLKYNGEGETQEGQLADILQLTYREVGKTPNNKYLVYVDKETRLISQWDFYKNAADEEPKFQLPWKDYKQYGPINLSGNRGKNALTDIEVWKMGQERLFVQW